MNYENILVAQENGVGTITINRPKKLNALNKATIAELHTAFDNLNKDASTKVIIITGSGEKAFVAGADMSTFFTLPLICLIASSDFVNIPVHSKTKSISCLLQGILLGFFSL